jgi:hypothetical protein
MSASETSAPSVSQSGMNECPAPTTRSFSARVTTAANSASVRGRAISRGAARTLPDQFDHPAMHAPMTACVERVTGVESRWLLAQNVDQPEDEDNERGENARVHNDRDEIGPFLAQAASPFGSLERAPPTSS